MDLGLKDLIRVDSQAGQRWFFLGDPCTLLKSQNRNAYAMTFFLKIQSTSKIPTDYILTITLNVSKMIMQVCF